MPRQRTGWLGIFLKLGSTSFGGPVAHLGYLRGVRRAPQMAAALDAFDDRAGRRSWPKKKLA
jgi:hypothetical protein